MMFLEHDFYSNFSKSLQSGDTEITSDIITDELSELIVYDYEKVFKLMETLDIKVHKNISDEVLADKLLAEMQHNKKLVRGISFLIAEKNNLINNNTDDRSGKKYIDYINRNLTKTFERILSNNNEKVKFKTDLMKKVKSKDSKVAERKRKVDAPNHFWTYVAIGAGVITLGVIIYKNWDKLSGKTPLEGDIDVPPPPVEPPAPAPPVEPPINVDGV